jgi:RNA 2',3'-cyclic 3'-phosphodiesterase
VPGERAERARSEAQSSGDRRVGDLRTFFAIELGGAARRVAAEVAKRLAAEPGGEGVRWTRPEAYHVTLRFVGRTPVDRVVAMARAVQDRIAGFAPFTIRLGALHALPTPRRPRVVVLDLAPAEPIVALAGAVEQGVTDAGFAFEERTFRPHLTLGRVREHGRRAPRLHASLGPSEPAPFDVASIVLFQSVHADGGSRYTPLARIEF